MIGVEEEMFFMIWRLQTLGFDGMATELKQLKQN